LVKRGFSPGVSHLSAAAPYRVGRHSERQDERAAAFVPARGAIVLGVDQQSDAADIIGDADAAVGRAQQESAAKTAALHGSIDREAAETEYGYIVTRQAFLRERRRPRIFDRGGAQRVEAEDALRRVRRRGDETFRAAAFRGSVARSVADRD
jgi:hypothetical protein